MTLSIAIFCAAIFVVAFVALVAVAIIVKGFIAFFDLMESPNEDHM